MARLHGRGSSRPSTQARLSRLALPWTLRRLIVPKEKESALTVSVFFCVILAMIFCTVPALRAQSPVDDVHVNPRIDRLQLPKNRFWILP